jgi:hypothetical protein
VNGRGGVAGIGFSLFGILAVVVVLGVAAAIAIPSLSGNKSGPSTGAPTTTLVGGAGSGTSPTASATTTGPTTGVPSEAAVAACEADAQTVATAVQDYEALHGGAPSAVTPAVLTSGSPPFLQSFPSSPDYAISIVNGVVMIAAPKTASAVPYNTAGACTRAGA